MTGSAVQEDLSEDAESLQNLREVDLQFEGALNIGSPMKLRGSCLAAAKVMVGEDADGKLKLAEDLDLDGFVGPAESELKRFADLGVTVRATYYEDEAELESFIAREDINIAIDNAKLEIVPSEVGGGWFEIRMPRRS